MQVAREDCDLVRVAAEDGVDRLESLHLLKCGDSRHFVPGWLTLHRPPQCRGLSRSMIRQTRNRPSGAVFYCSGVLLAPACASPTCKPTTLWGTT